MQSQGLNQWVGSVHIGDDQKTGQSGKAGRRRLEGYRRAKIQRTSRIVNPKLRNIKCVSPFLNMSCQSVQQAPQH